MLDDKWPLVLLGLRIGVAAALYLFLLVAVRALRAEIRARTTPFVAPRAQAVAPYVAAAPPPLPAPGRVEVVDRTPRPAAGDHLEVVAYDGDDAGSRIAGRSFALRGPALIGRDASNTIVLPERHVSARHARVFPAQGGWWVEDLGSTNGTWLNGHRVSGRERLDADGEVRFGPVVTRLVREPARPAARTTPRGSR